VNPAGRFHGTVKKAKKSFSTIFRINVLKVSEYSSATAGVNPVPEKFFRGTDWVYGYEFRQLHPALLRKVPTPRSPDLIPIV